MWGAQGAAEGCAMDGRVTATYPFYHAPPLLTHRESCQASGSPGVPLGWGLQLGS